MIDPTPDTCELRCLDLVNAEQIRAALPAADELGHGAAAARSLGDPTRLTIAAALLRGEETCVCDMAWVVGQPQNLVSHHLRQLRVAGMVTSRRQGRLVLYRLTERGRLLTHTVMAPASTPEVGHV